MKAFAIWGVLAASVHAGVTDQPPAQPKWATSEYQAKKTAIVELRSRQRFAVT